MIIAHPMSLKFSSLFFVNKFFSRLLQYAFDSHYENQIKNIINNWNWISLMEWNWKQYRWIITVSKIFIENVVHVMPSSIVHTYKQIKLQFDLLLYAIYRRYFHRCSLIIYCWYYSHIDYILTCPLLSHTYFNLPHSCINFTFYDFLFHLKIDSI